MNHHNEKADDESVKSNSIEHDEGNAGGQSTSGDRSNTGGGRDLKDVSQMQELTRKLENPLNGIKKDELVGMAKAFVQEHKFEGQEDLFIKAALLAQRPKDFDNIEELDEEDREMIRRETTHRWHQPFSLYFLAVLCGMAAVVQGMDETVVNGAQLYYTEIFGIKDNDLLIGVVNSAPYICCATLGCWLTDPLNRLLGRRGVIFLSCFIAGAASIWEAFTYSTWQLFAARFVLGLGIGYISLSSPVLAYNICLTVLIVIPRPKSATVPVFSAECAPANIRGALVMMWQMWTAFGIMLGNLVSVMFLGVKKDLAWRLMLGSTVVAPIFVCAQVYYCPESPRWYIKKGKHYKAFESLKRLRPCELQAARDLFYMAYAIKIEEESQRGRNLFKDFFTVPRVRRALGCSTIVMFFQQLCGVNVIAYYSSNIFVQSGFSDRTGIIASLGAGIINWLGALPAVFTIDTFGRRNLLLVTFPIMSLCLLFTGLCFLIPETSKAHIGLIALGIYLFEAVYSPGEGPVPFTYSAEVYPLYVRDLGMSVATATTWCFNAVLALTFPKLVTAFTITGAFCYYAAWNLIGFILVFLFLRESKGFTLEELDRVFAVPTKDFMMYQIKNIPYYMQTVFFRRKLPPPKPLYEDTENYDQNPENIPEEKPKSVEQAV